MVVYMLFEIQLLMSWLRQVSQDKKKNLAIPQKNILLPRFKPINTYIKCQT
jgi:hypothetical protein